MTPDTDWATVDASGGNRASSNLTIKFDLHSWGEYTKVEENICGAAACAVGLACFNEDFKAEGLGFEDHWMGGGGIVPTFNGGDGWSAVAEFFGIELDTAADLFHENHYKGRVTGASGAALVAARIRETIKKHQEK